MSRVWYKTCFTLPSHPSSKGMFDRFVQSFEKSLNKIVDEKNDLDDAGF